MSLNVGELTAYLRLNDEQFTHALNAAPNQARQAGSRIESSMQGAERATQGAADSTRRLGGGFNEAGSAATGLGSKLKVAGAAMAGLFAGGALISFFKDSVSAASDLNETVNKSNTIFGSAAGTIDKWSDNAAKSLGLSKAAALDAAAGFGNMFTQLGFAQDSAATMSTQVVQLSADLGSFNNLETSDVVDRMSGAFRGEYDSLQALVPNINAARVETEAMAETGKTSAAALTAQEKATAVLAIVQRDGAAAAGDFAKTSGGLANSTKIATAQMDEAKARIGQGLLPVWQKLVNLFSQYGVPAIEAVGTAFAALLQVLSPIIDILVSAVKAVADLPGPLLVAAAAIGGWMLFGTVSGLVASFAGSVVTAGIAVKGFLVSLGPIGIAVIALTTAMAFLMDSTDQTAEVTQSAADRWDRLKGTLDGVTGAVTDATRAQLAQEAQSTGMLSKLQDLGVSTKAYIDASAGVPGAQEKLAASVGKAAAAALKQSTAFQAVSKDLTAAGISQSDFTKALADGDPSEIQGKLDAYAESVAKASGNSSDATRIQGLFSAAIGETSGPLSTLGGVMNLSGDDASKFGAEADAAAQRALALGQNTDGAAAGVKKTGDAAATAADPMKDMGDATKEMGTAADDTTTATDFLIAKLNELSGGTVTAAQAARLNAAAFRDIGQSQRDLAQAQADLSEKQQALTKLQGDGKASAADLAAASRDVADASDKVKDAQDGVSDSGIKARDSALSLAAAAFTQAGGFNNLKAANAAATKVTEAQRTAWINAQPQADILSGKAKRVATELFGIPNAVATALTEQGAANVKGKAAEVKGAVDNIPQSHNTDLTATSSGFNMIDDFRRRVDAVPTVHQTIFESIIASAPKPPGGFAGGRVGSILRGFSFGGQLPGMQPSDKTYDNLSGMVGNSPIRLQSEEWVQPVSAVRKYGAAFMSDIQTGRLPVPAGYSAGGQLGSRTGSGGPSVVVNNYMDWAHQDVRTEVIVDGRLHRHITDLERSVGQSR